MVSLLCSKIINVRIFQFKIDNKKSCYEYISATFLTLYTTYWFSGKGLLSQTKPFSFVKMEKRFHMKTHMQMHFHFNVCVCVCAYVNVLFEMDFSRQNKSQKKTTKEELDNQFSVRHPISHSPLLTFATMTNHTTNHLHQKRTSSGQLS